MPKLTYRFTFMAWINYFTSFSFKSLNKKKMLPLVVSFSKFLALFIPKKIFLCIFTFKKC
jgi:hypothetical protein